MKVIPPVETVPTVTVPAAPLPPPKTAIVLPELSQTPGAVPPPDESDQALFPEVVFHDPLPS